jgi:acyl carrier protein
MGKRKIDKDNIDVQIREGLRTIVRDVLGLPAETPINDTDSLQDDLGDSLDIVEIIMDAEELLEQLLGVEILIPEEEAFSQFKTIEDAAVYIRDHLPPQQKK